MRVKCNEYIRWTICSVHVVKPILSFIDARTTWCWVSPTLCKLLHTHKQIYSYTRTQIHVVIRKSWLKYFFCFDYNVFICIVRWVGGEHLPQVGRMLLNLDNTQPLHLSPPPICQNTIHSTIQPPLLTQYKRLIKIICRLFMRRIMLTWPQHLWIVNFNIGDMLKRQC